jgi:hypothetical protein
MIVAAMPAAPGRRRRVAVAFSTTTTTTTTTTKSSSVARPLLAATTWRLFLARRGRGKARRRRDGVDSMGGSRRPANARAGGIA